jgi:uncharacterized protein (DUF1499 family)
MKWLTRGLLALLVLALLAIIGTVIAARIVGPPQQLGVRGGMLTPCPETPNCVATQGANPEQQMEPIPYDSSAEEAQERLRRIVSGMERSTILEERPGYLHVLFRSPTMGFPDDVEFLFDTEAQVIHFRAAARMGQSDMGANRARMEQISAAFRDTR